MKLLLPSQFGGKQRDAVAENQREHLLLECQALLSDDPAAYAGPLAELERQLLILLAPTGTLHPADPNNILLTLERAHQNGLAELEKGGYSVDGISVYAFFHRLEVIGKSKS